MMGFLWRLVEIKRIHFAKEWNKFQRWKFVSNNAETIASYRISDSICGHS